MQKPSQEHRGVGCTGTSGSAGKTAEYESGSVHRERRGETHVRAEDLQEKVRAHQAKTRTTETDTPQNILSAKKNKKRNPNGKNRVLILGEVLVNSFMLSYTLGMRDCLTKNHTGVLP